MLLVKPAGGDCNLSCRYCFYHLHGKGRMSDELAARTVNSYMMQPILRHAICFQGGEPMLMPIDFYRRLDFFGCDVSIQTNGTLITREWAEFFARNRWLVGVSLDGPRDINEKTRGHTDEAIRGIRLLEEYGVEFNILSVVSPENCNRLDEVDDYLKRNFAARRIQYIRENGSKVDWWSAEEADCCGKYLVVEHDGTVYPCDFYVGEEYRLGNVQTDSWAKLLDHKFNFKQDGKCPQINNRKE